MNILENELKKEKTQRTGKSYKLKNKIRKPMEDPHPPPRVKGGIPFPRTHFSIRARGPTLQPAVEEATNHRIVL